MNLLIYDHTVHVVLVIHIMCPAVRVFTDFYIFLNLQKVRLYLDKFSLTV